MVPIRQLDRTTKAEHQTRMALGNSLIAEGAALQRTGLIGQRFDALDRLAGAAKILGSDRKGRDRWPEIRKHTITALGLTDMRAVGQRDCGDIYSHSVDAALERYAVVECLGTVVVYRLDDHRELVRLPGPENRGFWYAATMFSPDGELLVACYVGSGGGGGDLLRVWHLRRRELLGSLQNRGGGAFYGGAFSPDSRRFLFCPPEGGIDVWDRGERRVVRRLPLDFAPHYLALDPQGRRLAVNNKDGAAPRVAILDLESGRVLADWRSQVGNTNLAWSADGQLLAIGSYSDDSRVYVWNVRRGELASVLQGHVSYIINVQFAHTGYLLATAGGSTRLWDAASGELLADAAGSLLGFAPDDRRLGFWSGRRSASGTSPGVTNAAYFTQRCWATVASGETPWGCHRPRSVPMAGCWRPATRMAFDSGRPTPVGRSPTSRIDVAKTFCFTPTVTASSAPVMGPLSLADPSRSRSRARSLRVGPPELLRETAGAEWDKASWLPDHRTVALIDNSQGRVLARRFDSSSPRLEPSGGPGQRGESTHDLGRNQSRWALAGGRRLERGGDPGLGSAPTQARAGS